MFDPHPAVPRRTARDNREAAYVALLAAADAHFADNRDARAVAALRATHEVNARKADEADLINDAGHHAQLRYLLECGMAAKDILATLTGARSHDR